MDNFKNPSTCSWYVVYGVVEFYSTVVQLYAKLFGRNVPQRVPLLRRSTMVKTLKRRNQSVAGDKLSSHRRESKSQQPEVNQVKGTEETGVRQKKVRFSTANELPTTTTFTPEASAGVKLLDPIPLTTSERQPTNKNTTTSKYKTATEAPTTKLTTLPRVENATIYNQHRRNTEPFATTDSSRLPTAKSPFRTSFSCSRSTFE